MVKSIYLQDGEEIFVDDEDYERVNQYTWYKRYTGNTRVIVSSRHFTLNNFISKNSIQKTKNNDFTKSNLTTKGTKGIWRRPKSRSSSKYKGVSWNKNSKKWTAIIHVNGETVYIGAFYNEDDAGRAYNNAVYKFYEGEAFVNDIGKDNRTPIRQYKTNKNQNFSRNGISKYKGVYQIRKSNEFFSVYVSFSKKNKYVSCFKNVEKAALSYNKCAIYLYGDEAILNDVPMTDELKEFIANWEIPDKIKALKVGVSNE